MKGDTSRQNRQKNDIFKKNNVQSEKRKRKINKGVDVC